MSLLAADWTEVNGGASNGSYFDTSLEGANLAIVSTEGSRAVVSDPALVGQRYIDRIGSAAAEALGALEWTRYGMHPEMRPHPLVILRGGATFSPSAALEALGHRPGPQSFLTSESQRPADGATTSTQRYWKFEGIKGETTLLICDIVATGETVLAAVERALAEAPTIERVVVIGFITVEGAARIVAALSGRLTVLLASFEAFFRLPPATDRSRGLTTPCDFRRSDIVCGGRYLELLTEDPGLAEEQCVVYDGGERAFAPDSHLTGRDRYLTGVAALDDETYRKEILYRSGIAFGDRSRILLPADGRNDPLLALGENFQQLLSDGRLRPEK